nr:hypothetical protein [Tanacetum cinerariifolium]
RVFWGAGEELSDGGSPRVIMYGYNGLPMQPVAPPSPDYIPGPKEPHTPPIPQDEDERYVIESDPEEDPEEYEDDEIEDGPVDYPMDGGDDGDDDDGDSSGDDVDDEDEDEEDEEKEEEEENLALADSAAVIPTVELVSPHGGIEPVIPPPSTDTTTIGARITVQLQAAISLPPEVEVERLLAMPTPPPSLLTSLSPPSAEERLARMASTQALIDAVTITLPSPPLPPLPLPLYIPPHVDRRYDVPETEMLPCKRFCLFTLGSRYKIGESSTTRPTRGRGIDYGSAEAVPEITPMTLGEVNTRVTELAELHEHDIQDLYALLEDAQESRTRISQRVTIDSLWVSLLMEDRMAHQETILIVEEKAYAARVYAHEFQVHAYKTQLQLQGTLIQTQHQTPDTDGRDSLSDGRHETRDGQHAGQIVGTTQGPNIPPNNTNLNNMTLESVQAMIDQALMRNSTNGDGSHSSHKDNRRNVQTAHPYFYADFMKCQPLNIKGTEGMVDLTRLLDNIYGNVKSSKPKTLDETIELANDFMDQKLRTYVERQTNNKRKADDLSRNNHGSQQQPAKRQNVTKVYNMG